MNDIVDGKAKSYLKGCDTSDPPKPLTQPTLLYESWGYSIDRVQQLTVNKKRTYDVLFAPRIFEYLENHHKMALKNPGDIDWDPSLRVINRLPQGLKRWRWNFTTGCIGVGRMLVHCKFHNHSNCPLCQAPDEKVSHIIH